MSFKIFQRFHKYKTQLIMIFSSYIGTSLFGLMMSWSIPVINLLKDPEKTPLPEVIDDIAASWIGSLVFIGTITGLYVGNALSTKHGRIRGLIVGNSICAFSFILQCFFTFHINTVYAQRLLQGLGVTLINMNTFAYIGEIASPEIRGSLMALIPIFYTTMSLILILSAPVISFKGVGYMGLTISVIAGVLSCFMSESPLWLAINGKKAASDSIMKHLNREDVITLDDKHKSSPWKEIFQTRANRKAIFIIMPLVILESGSGLSNLIFFSTSIYEMANLNINSMTATIISSSVGVVIAFASSTVVDRAGRRVLMLVSTSGTCISMAILGMYFYLDHVNYSAIDKIKWLPILCVISFMIFFNFGFATIPTILVSELFNNCIRTLGPAVTMGPAMIVGFLFTTAFGYMITYLGIHWTFWVHSIINALAFLFSLAFLPETRGKTLSEIQEMLNR